MLNTTKKRIAPGRISLCFIMKNEAHVLERMLNSLLGLVDEAIVVDTGSTDESIKIARSWGVKVLQDPWQDDFSRPRNISMDQATGEWIIIIDPDETISRQDHDEIRRLCANPSIAAYRLDTRNYTNNPLMQGYHPNPGHYPEEKGFTGYVPSVKTRLVQRRTGIRFQKIWHELLDYDLVDKKLEVLPSKVPVHHLPSRTLPQQVKQRRPLYLRLGEKKVALDPKDPIAWWELAVAEYIEGYNQRAIYSLKKSLVRGSPNPERFFLYNQLAKKIGREGEARFAFEKAVAMLFPSLTHIDESLRGKHYL